MQTPKQDLDKQDLEAGQTLSSEERESATKTTNEPNSTSETADTEAKNLAEVEPETETGAELKFETEAKNLVSSLDEQTKLSPVLSSHLESFDTKSFNPKLLETIKAIGWQQPTPIQAMSLPFSLKKQDLAGFAQTGTGKTGVFLLTVAQRFLSERTTDQDESIKKSKQCLPFAVVVVPTRELAVQIEEESKKLLKPLGIRSLAVYGGSNWENQAKKLSENVHLILATPGRLKDYLEKDVISFAETSIFICDEVDRMFEMGFVEDVEFFMSKLQEGCQKLLFSATSNPKVKELAFKYLEKPEYISLNTEEIIPENVEQHAVICEVPKKFSLMLGLLKKHNPERAIIFANTKLTCSWLHYKLKGNDYSVDLITGDLPQAKRLSLIANMKQGKIKILIATDIASRGIHISGVSHIYNFDIPDDAASYVHRIGRTARAGALGQSFSLVCDEYGSNYEQVQKLLGKDAPKPVWYIKEDLLLEDKSGNPFMDDFGLQESKPDHMDRPRKVAFAKRERSKEEVSQTSEKTVRSKVRFKKTSRKPQNFISRMLGLCKKILSAIFKGKKQNKTKFKTAPKSIKTGYRKTK